MCYFLPFPLQVSDKGITPMLENLEAHIYESGIADMVESAEIITQDSEKYVERLLQLSKLIGLILKSLRLLVRFRLFAVHVVNYDICRGVVGGWVSFSSQGHGAIARVVVRLVFQM